MAAGDTGEHKVFHEISRLRVQYPDHRIFPALIQCSGPPYDVGIDIDHHYYRAQVKTTLSITDKGRMVFDTSRNEDDETGLSHRVAYTEDDIDFFILYCDCDDEGKEWLGIALLEECNLSTTVCKHGKMFKNSRRAEDMQFDKRIRELIETKQIKPLPIYTETKVVEESESKPMKILAKPTSDSEFFNLMAEYGWHDDWMANDNNISEATIQKWRADLIYNPA